MSQNRVPFDRMNRDRTDELTNSALNQIIERGNISSTGTVTLSASTTTTVKKDPRFQKSQLIYFDPETANASKELFSGGMYVSTRVNGEFTITHSNCSQTDRTFRYLILG